MLTGSRMTAFQYGLFTCLVSLALGALGGLLGWPWHLDLGASLAAGAGVGWTAYARYGRRPMNDNRPI